MLGLKLNHVSKRGHWLKLDIQGDPSEVILKDMNKSNLYQFTTNTTKCISRDTVHHSRLELLGDERLYVQSVVFYVVHSDLTVSTTEPIAG